MTIDVTNARIEINTSTFQPIMRCEVGLTMEYCQDMNAQVGEEELCRQIGVAVLAGLRNAPRKSITDLDLPK